MGIRSPGISGADTHQTQTIDADASQDRNNVNRKIEIANQRLKERLKKEKEMINPYIKKPPLLVQ
jgi:hypothetical protein